MHIEVWGKPKLVEIVMLLIGYFCASMNHFDEVGEGNYFT
jgi:hypothetical protein